MLLSMTGFGEADAPIGDLHASVEIRSVNNRHFKLQLRSPEGFSAFDSAIEKQLRTRIARGSVSVQIRLQRGAAAAASAIHLDVAEQYWRSLVELSNRLQVNPPADVTALLGLPGIVADTSAEDLDRDDAWKTVQRLLTEATDRLHDFRLREGAAMAEDLTLQAGEIETRLQAISARAPGVVTAYRDRILQRVSDLLAAGDAKVTPSDLIREVSIFADRCDINEEITRLRAHLEQFAATIADESASQGRKLDFLCQEMGREINTIGSKANDVEIAHEVVAAKTALERIREVVQNVE